MVVSQPQRSLARGLACALGAAVGMSFAAATAATPSHAGQAESQERDPRIGLRPGVYDAGEAAFGMERLASLPRPGPFPLTPAGVADEGTVRVREWGANTDMAFRGSLLFVGSYDGVNIYEIADPKQPRLVRSIVCPGGQGDVSVYGRLLFLSVEAMDGRLDCGTQGFPAEPVNPHRLLSDAEPGAAFKLPPSLSSPDRMRGIRIFDIGDLSQPPRQIAAVQTCRGSHTHTLVPDPRDRGNLYLYVSGTASLRPPGELPGCATPVSPEGADAVVFEVISVPLAHPERASVVARPAISVRPDTSPTPDGPPLRAAEGCHDITVLAPAGLAAASCIGRGLLLDVSDPVRPRRLAVVADPRFSFWHSATFSNDGRKVVFADEWGAGQLPHCRASDPRDWGADAIFALRDGQPPALASFYKLPAPQTASENCTAHNGSLIPVPGRDIEVQAWYQGGVSIVDFTDAAHPFEIGYFDRGPLNELHPVVGGAWSAYFYNGYIYASEMTRGVDIFQLVPSRYLTQNEIDAARQIHLEDFNAQSQRELSWPPTALTARAYLDQLARDQALPPALLRRLRAAMRRGETGSPTRAGAQRSAQGSARMVAALRHSAARAPTPEAAHRMLLLSNILYPRVQS